MNTKIEREVRVREVRRQIGCGRTWFSAATDGLTHGLRCVHRLPEIRRQHSQRSRLAIPIRYEFCRIRVRICMRERTAEQGVMGFESCLRIISSPACLPRSVLNPHTLHYTFISPSSGSAAAASKVDNDNACPNKPHSGN